MLVIPDADKTSTEWSTYHYSNLQSSCPHSSGTRRVVYNGLLLETAYVLVVHLCKNTQTRTQPFYCHFPGVSGLAEFPPYSFPPFLIVMQGILFLVSHIVLEFKVLSCDIASWSIHLDKVIHLSSPLKSTFFFSLQLHCLLVFFHFGTVAVRL